MSTSACCGWVSIATFACKVVFFLFLEIIFSKFPKVTQVKIYKMASLLRSYNAKKAEYDDDLFGDSEDEMMKFDKIYPTIKPCRTGDAFSKEDDIANIVPEVFLNFSSPSSFDSLPNIEPKHGIELDANEIGPGDPRILEYFNIYQKDCEPTRIKKIKTNHTFCHFIKDWNVHTFDDDVSVNWNANSTPSPFINLQINASIWLWISDY